MGAIVFGIILALVIAGIAVHIMVAQMKPVSRRREAAQYIRREDVAVLQRDDRYIRTDVTRRRIEREREG